jgi:hypothetical protein
VRRRSMQKQVLEGDDPLTRFLSKQFKSALAFGSFLDVSDIGCAF